MTIGWPIPHWEEAPALFDRCVLDGFVLPGVWTCNLECKRDLDVKKAAGQDGATYKDKGYVPSEVLLTGRFLAEDWTAYQDIVRALHPQTFGKERRRQRKELTLEHPNALLMGVTRVYLVSIQAPTWDGGIAEAAIELIQAVKPAAVKKKPATADGPEAPDPLQGEPAFVLVRFPNDVERTY